MKRIIIGLGSNIEPEQHLTSAAQALRQHFSDIIFSPVYRSQAVGMEGDDFLNACAMFTYGGGREALLSQLKGLEDQHGRDRSHGSWKPRTLDLDLLMQDDQVVDADIYKYAHIYVPIGHLIALKLPCENDINQLLKVNICL
ncbi:MAG: 2-amino-4-hydroxy-6-hydroxymethyldihydropteridine diphosphokinase [Zetaproteobacteria bacterium]|nr:2-amino-4-hydroxy-6-hydroxymethyldihydropteridine diphosphokinase [Zetaproteobacteria bacterium]